MKTGIHPEYMVAKVTCACGRVTETRATVPELHVDICSHCHPFFTGRQKLVDTAGRVERFRAKYGNGEASPSAEGPAEAEESANAPAEVEGTPDAVAEAAVEEVALKVEPTAEADVETMPEAVDESPAEVTAEAEAVEPAEAGESAEAEDEKPAAE